MGKFVFAAVAAAMLSAGGQASATTWVKYEVSGSGTLWTYSYPFYVEKRGPADFKIFVTAEVDPESAGYGNGFFGYSSDGSVFTGQPITEYLSTSTRVDGTAPGKLLANYVGGNVSFGEWVYADVTYAGVVGGLRRDALASQPASGTASYRAVSKGSAFEFSGAVSGFAVLGAVPAYQRPSFDLVITGDLLPVPEPATWAMLLVGAGAVGTGLRRGRRRAVFASA